MLTPLLSALLLAAPADAPAAPAVPANKAIELGDFGGRLRSVRLKVNGHEGVFTLDTGGGVSLLSPAFAKKIGCTPWAALTGFRLDGQRLDLPRCEDVRFTLPDGTALKPVTAGVVDLQPLLFKGAPQADGSLALDALDGKQFTLDLGNGTLVIETPETLAAETKDANAIPMRLARQAGGAALGVMVPMKTPQGDVWMTLDSGGGPPVLVRDRVAQAAGADPANQELQPFKLKVGDATAVDTRAFVKDMIVDGVIGMPVLVRWKLSFDLEGDRLWLRSTR
ncbi:MAG: hypothetical protein HOQ01_03030 [Lysobacter sp.]|nr:hypothetical protein [Lysobacter sp.]